VDQGIPVAAVRATIGCFGAEVLRIVEGCTDADRDPKPAWRPRKEAYVAHLAEADRAILLVSASDKLHNARAIVGDLRTIDRKVTEMEWLASASGSDGRPVHG
jgi:(p)ppGpp synthase/HD superfamily hydrolase